MNDIDNIGMTGNSKMPHSHSTPAGVDGGSRTPPTTPRKAGKMLAVRVQMLDDTITMFQVQAKALGRVLFDQVCKQLHLLEADYFGLEYQEPNGTKYWLDLEKPVCRQVGLSLVDPLLRFCVKFYTPDPAQLEEEFTRYLFCLQIKRDLSHGLLQCNDNTAALMASYIVQAECGDYVIEDYPDHTYLSTYKFVPHQDQELERRIMENHKKHAGQSPAEADLNLLETARRCELYGMKMHPAKDHEAVPLNLAVAHMGIVVFQNYTKINTFSWAKIRKISFKRKRFLIKLHPEGYGYYKDTVEFFFEGRNECKNFWKKCVENHGFFRCSVVKRVIRQKTRVLSRGSSFRYSGKTQKQIVEFVRDNYVKRQTFQRSNSFRQTSGGRALQGSEGGGYRGATPSSSLMGSSSISAHPLLPLGDPALGTPALSLSCGSMTLDSPTTVTSVSVGGTSHRRDDTAMSFRTLTSIDVHSPATPNQAHPVHRQLQQHQQQFAMSQQQQHRISSAGRISPSNSSPPEFPPPRPMPRHPWQRSASCRELYASSFEDSGKARPRDDKPPIIGTDESALAATFQLPSQGELDNPVTRYDESNRSYSAASSKLPSLDHDSVPERVYSSSYPGTSSLSTESGHEESGPAGDLSHDDLSHDSYELLEREHEFEYPESYSSPREENEPLSDNSDEGIEHEMFQMDSETDSFVKHRSVKSSDKHLFKSVLADLKNVAAKAKSIDRYSTVPKTPDSNLIVTESRIQRTGTQIERKFEVRHANSLDHTGKPPLLHQDSARKDPVIIQVQKQKLNVLNELKNLKPKHKITHVDSEILRDEGIMRPKSRIDDDLSPVDPNKTILEPVTARCRTVRARSIASLEDQPPRIYVETGSLGRAYASGDKRCRDADFKVDKMSKLLEKERKSLEREERKRVERENSREARRMEKADSRERRSVGRVDSRERRSVERLDFHGSHTRGSMDRQDSRELRRSIERLDSRERSCERVDSRERNSGARRHEHREPRVKSVERLDSRELRKSMENLDTSPKERNAATRHHEIRERRERSIERLDSRESRKSPGRLSSAIDYDQRSHTLERFDSGSKSPRDRPSPRVKSVDKLDLRDNGRPTFDFDPRTIERLSSLERNDSIDRGYDRREKAERKATADRRNSNKLDNRDRKSFDRLDSRERRSLECLDREDVESRQSTERLDQRETRKVKNRAERGRSEEKPRERDDWKSLERARKDDERRERERQSKFSMDSRTETVVGVPNERDSIKVKSVFTEYEPKVIGGVVVGFEDSLLPGHVPVERTKSDPNPGRQRIGSNSKRHMLMHQKSIDLTPADSGDEDPFSDGASANCKANSDIPYTLHKRHVMNGTASDEKSESDSGTKTNKKTKDLPKLPLKMVTDLSCIDLTKLTTTNSTIKATTVDKPKSILVSPDKHKMSQTLMEKTKVAKSPSAKLSPTDNKSLVCHLSPKDSGGSGSSGISSVTKQSSHEKFVTKTTSLDRYKNVAVAAAAVAADKKTCTKSASLERKTAKLSPTEPNVTIISMVEKRSPKISPTDPSVTIVSVIEKSRSLDSSSRGSGSDRSPIKSKFSLNLGDVVGMEIKKELERRENAKLKVPDDGLEKQDSIEKIPLPEIPVKIVTKEKPPLPIRVSSMEKRPNASIEKQELPVKPAVPSKDNLTIKLAEQSTNRETLKMSSNDAKKSDDSPHCAVTSEPESATELAKTFDQSKTLEKPTIPEKTKLILDRIQLRFSETNDTSPFKLPRPKIIDTGYDDFVDPVADLPYDDVPIKPAPELDSLKVPDFNPYMLRPHAEPLRSKSLSLAEEKAPIDTLLSPEVENKVFAQQDVSPKRAKRTKTETKKDFKKQSKSLEGDKPPLKKSGSKESRISPASSKIDKSKLKLGEMPQEIIIIDSTDVVPEVSIVQKGRSKSVTRLPDRSASGSREEKDDAKKTRAKSASVDDDMIKGTVCMKIEKQRPKSLGISMSLGSTERESLDKVSPKKTSKIQCVSSKPDVVKNVVTPKHSPSKVLTKSAAPSQEDERISELQSVVVLVKGPGNVKKASNVAKESGERTLIKADSVVDHVNSRYPQEIKEEKSPTSQTPTKSPIASRKPGQNSVLFARARLGLSEGSAIGSLQRQGATQSPTAQRRAKSLDAPVISVHKLPPANAFSSKDDTVDTLEESEDQENDSPDNGDTNQGVKQQSIQMEASPNHRSESTDHTTIPEIFTDSLSPTEISAQYLESPLTECQEITTCPDLIPYEHDAQLQSSGRVSNRESVESNNGPKIEGATRFIDQSSVESGAETDLHQDTSADLKSWPGGSDLSGKSAFSSRSKENCGSNIQTSKSKESDRSRTEISSGTDSSDGDKRNSNENIEFTEPVVDVVADVPSTRGSVDREEIPNVTVSIVEETIEDPVGEFGYFDSEDTPDMVKSPIQISIEECSDGEAPESDEIQDEILEQAIFQAKEIEKRRLDSGDTSEDTLDALDQSGQMQMEMQTQGLDSDLSSPDYGADKMDEKTLVEVELTPEYLEMRKEEEEGVAEELPEDEPTAKERKDDDENNKLSIDKKYRLSTERSRSEETNTWTPDREDPDSSSCSIARPLGIGQIQPIFDRREIAMIKEARKEGSLEEESSHSGSQPVARPPELSCTWKPFPLESSGSSSLDDGWLPQDDNNHHRSQSEDSNGPNEDSFQEDLDFPTGLVYPINPDMIANYGAFALSRTLSRISERSTTSEQDKSDLEDSFKPSSRSPSIDDESLISSDRQPSLSSDPPSGTALPSVSDDRRTSSELPDIPIDVFGAQDDETKSPRSRKSRLQLQASEDWPSPPSSPLFDTPIVSHVETFYMEIKPEEAVRVTVTDSTEDTPGCAHEDSDSSDENRTLHDDLHSTLLEDGQSSASATTVDGTVKIAVKPKSNSYITGSSHSEDTSMGLSMSEWSSSNNTVRQFCQYSGTKSDDNSLAELGASISDWSGSTTVIPQQYYSAVATEKSQSDTTTSDKSVTSMRPNSKCQHIGNSPVSRGGDGCRDDNDDDDDGDHEEDDDGDDNDMPTGGIYDKIENNDDNDEPIDEFDEARKFVESQFDEHRRRFDDGGGDQSAVYTDISPPRIIFQNEYDETIEEDIVDDYAGQLANIPGPIPEEDEEDQLYDNVPAMKYSSGDQVRMKVSPGDSSEDMHERYADLASRVRSAVDDEWSFDEHHRGPQTNELESNAQHRSNHRFDRGFSEPCQDIRYGTRSTERPVVVPTRAKSTPYYSTTSLSGESTTSSPPMQVRAQIRTKTMGYSSCRSPQSEGDTSSSMDSPGHTPDRGQRAYRRKRQQNAKRRHRVAVDLEVRDGHIVSSTDSSFDVTSLPPPLLTEASIDIADDDDIHRATSSRHEKNTLPRNTNDVEASKDEEPSKQENNNSFFADNAISEKQINGVAEINVNVNVINTPDLSPVKNIRNGDVEDPEIRKTKRWPTDKAYYIAKELLMTERTYKKDLDVINVWFREEVSREADLEGETAVGLIELLADVHGPCLQEMEARLARWESNARHNIGDFLYNTLLNVLPLYDQYLEHLIPVLEKMEYSIRTSRRFDQLCRDFESQKHCYLPLSSFLLKPLQRLLHYNSIIDRLLDHYPKDHTDFEDCLAARDRLGETLLEGLTVLNQAENMVQLCELQRDISGFDNLVQEGRRFIRQGCLQKYSHKGFQQRMFFLFSDILLYTFRTQQPTQCFRVHGQLPLKGMVIQDSDNKTGTDYVFIIQGHGNQPLTVAANSEEEKERWLEDLNMTIAQADTVEGKTPYLCLKSCSSADEIGSGAGPELDRTNCGGAKASQRSNTTVHVCWHRNTSISYSDQLRAFQNQLSGFLLRKFKNSNGWQKLWVVFTNFCLFFYKSHQDDFPLACLPLLGYAVSTPSDKDGISKDFVFKLQFKNHVYFFRAESDFTFSRWMEVIRSATQESYIPVNFSRKESY